MWCYAYTSADLISQRLGRRVSAIPLAVDYLLEDPRRLHDSPHPAVRELVRKQPELIESIRTDRFRRSVEDTNSIRGFVDSGGYLEDATLLANVGGICAEDKLPSSSTRARQLVERARKTAAARAKADPADLCTYPADLRPPASTSILMEPLAWREAQLWRAEIERACPREPVSVPLIPRTFYANADSPTAARDRKAALDEIDDALSRGRIAGLAYDAGHFAPMPPNTRPGDGQHASVIAARKLIGGKCRYLIRNTWGKDSCSAYKPAFRRHCEKGDIWVTREEIGAALTYVTTLE